MLTPEKQFREMFGSKDPVKDLEHKVYQDFENLKHEVQQSVRGYVENRLQGNLLKLN